MSSQDGLANHWTDEDILVLLCSLNRDIKDIRAEFEADKKEGTQFALEKLRIYVGNGCKALRVKRKVEHLWKEAGPSTGPHASHSSPSDPIFLHGAWTRTLPSLDALYPGMLDKIALAGKLNVSIARINKNHHAGGYNFRRRAELENEDPIECTCGFSHDASTAVYCETCSTWQHIWCYYGSDSLSAPDEDHKCKKCDTMDDFKPQPDSSLGSEVMNESFLFAFQRLQIQPQHNDRIIGKRSKKTVTRVIKTQDSGSATDLDRSLEEDYGLQDSEIKDSMRTMQSTIATIAHSITTGDFLFELPTSGAWKEHLDAVEVIRQSNYNKDQTIIPSSSKNVHYCKIILGFALWNSVFYGTGVLGHMDNLDSTPISFAEKLLATYHDTDLSLNEVQILQGIHRKAWIAMARDHSAKHIKKHNLIESKKFAWDLLSVLSGVIKRNPASGDFRPLETADEWITTTNNGPPRFHLLINLCSLAINLRSSLALSDYCYELWYPTSFGDQCVEEDPQESAQAMLCVAPAIIEYEPETIPVPCKNFDSSFFRRNFIRSTKDQRAKGTVVCPATITYVSGTILTT